MNVELNTWFYTLSTIAQTCAAILALGGAFVVYKLDKVEGAIHNYRGRVIRILLAWLRDSRQPDKFYDVRDEIVLDRYKKIVANDNDEIFDSEGVESVYLQFENVRKLVGAEGGFELSNGVILNYEEKKRWVVRMAKLYEQNIDIKNDIFRRFKRAIVLLGLSIVASFVFLVADRVGIPRSDWVLIPTVLLGIFSVVYSAYSVWKIATFEHID